MAPFRRPPAGRCRSPAWARPAAHPAWPSAAAGGPALMVRTLQTGATHPIAMPCQGQANDYAFTPDGRRLITTVSFLTATNQVTYQVRSIPANARSAAAGRVLQGVPEAGCSAG